MNNLLDKMQKKYNTPPHPQPPPKKNIYGILDFLLYTIPSFNYVDNMQKEKKVSSPPSHPHPPKKNMKIWNFCFKNTFLQTPLPKEMEIFI